MPFSNYADRKVGHKALLILLLAPRRSQYYSQNCLVAPDALFLVYIGAFQNHPAAFSALPAEWPASRRPDRSSPQGLSEPLTALSGAWHRPPAANRCAPNRCVLQEPENREIGEFGGGESPDVCMSCSGVKQGGSKARKALFVRSWAGGSRPALAARFDPRPGPAQAPRAGALVCLKADGLKP